MNKYMVTSPHRTEECLSTLDEVKDKGPEFLKKFNFGCRFGDHTGYALLEGNSEEEVRNSLPSAGRKNAKITQVESFDANQIQALHEPEFATRR